MSNEDPLRSLMKRIQGSLSKKEETLHSQLLAQRMKQYQREGEFSAEEKSEILKICLDFVDESLEPQSCPKMEGVIAELFVIEKLLEKIYIHSTDIESAQFFNKEISLRVNMFLNDLVMEQEQELNQDSLLGQIDSIFEEIVGRKRKYFEEVNREVN